MIVHALDPGAFILGQAEMLGEQDLAEAALDIFVMNSEKAMQCGLAYINASTMLTITSMDNLNIDESQLLISCISWACAEAQRRGNGYTALKALQSVLRWVQLFDYHTQHILQPQPSNVRTFECKRGPS